MPPQKCSASVSVFVSTYIRKCLQSLLDSDEIPAVTLHIYIFYIPYYKLSIGHDIDGGILLNSPILYTDASILDGIDKINAKRDLLRFPDIMHLLCQPTFYFKGNTNSLFH